MIDLEHFDYASAGGTEPAEKIECYSCGDKFDPRDPELIYAVIDGEKIVNCARCEIDNPLSAQYLRWEQSAEDRCPRCLNLTDLRIELKAGSGFDPDELHELVMAERCETCGWQKEF